MTSYLLTLPFELRLQIYSYLHQRRPHLDLCKELANSRLPGSAAATRPSPLRSYLNKRKATSQWARDHGLHLLATSFTLCQEYMDLIKRRVVVLVVHCAGCLARLLGHLVRDLGIRTPVFKEVRMKVGFPEYEHDYDVRVESIIADFQRVVRAHYGHHDLVIVCDEPIEATRYWSVERVKIMGRAPRKRLHNQSDGVVEGEDDSSGQDEVDEEELPRCYRYTPGVKELERRIKRWKIDDVPAPESRQWEDLARAMRHALPAPDDDHWRMSRKTREEYEAAGKNPKGLVVREEIWVSMLMTL